LYHICAPTATAFFRNIDVHSFTGRKCLYGYFSTFCTAGRTFASAHLHDLTNGKFGRLRRVIFAVCVHKFATNKMSVIVHIAQIGNEKSTARKICKSVFCGV